MAHPWPACVHTPPTAPGSTSPSSASSRAIQADLPPSSRKVFFSVSAPQAMIRLPTAVDPVNVTMSTRGSVVSTSPTRWSDGVTMFTTPAGMSVSSTISFPSIVPIQGVSGAGLSTTVLPAASAGPSLAMFRYSGKFHGVMAATTPIGSRRMSRRCQPPIDSRTGRKCSYSYEVACSAQ